MDPTAYESMSAVEDKHWWFVARRRIIASLIERFVRPPAGAKVLEAGCGTGGNLALLARYGKLDAFEYDPTARAKAAAKQVAEIDFGALPDQVARADGSYDLIALLDVLEHIEEDEASLQRLGGLLRDDGKLLLTVPAVPSLWSEHDVIHHHHRRYTRRSLEQCIAKAGLKVERIGYFNSLLFPIAWVQRQAQRLTGRHAPLDAIPGKLLNGALEKVFGLERHILGKVDMPIGLSLFAVVSRKA